MKLNMSLTFCHCIRICPSHVSFAYNCAILGSINSVFGPYNLFMKFMTWNMFLTCCRHLCICLSMQHTCILPTTLQSLGLLVSISYLNRIICSWIETCSCFSAALSERICQQCTNMCICASNFYFAHNCCPNLTPRSNTTWGGGQQPTGFVCFLLLCSITFCPFSMQNYAGKCKYYSTFYLGNSGYGLGK
jgi:hypothetical protein